MHKIYSDSEVTHGYNDHIIRVIFLSLFGYITRILE